MLVLPFLCERTMEEPVRRRSTGPRCRPQAGAGQATRAVPVRPERSTPSGFAHLTHKLGPAIQDREIGFGAVGAQANNAPCNAEIPIALQHSDLVGSMRI